jgi:hypothetical protein
LISVKSVSFPQLLTENESVGIKNFRSQKESLHMQPAAMKPSLGHRSSDLETSGRTRFLSTNAAARYSGIPAGTLRAWRCQGIGPKFYKPRGRALYDIADLDEFIRSGIRVSSVRASKEERNVYLPAG